MLELLLSHFLSQNMDHSQFLLEITQMFSSFLTSIGIDFTNHFHFCLTIYSFTKRRQYSLLPLFSPPLTILSYILFNMELEDDVQLITRLEN